MKFRSILKSISKLLYIEAILLVAPLLVAIYYQEPMKNILAFVYTIGIILVFATPSLFFSKKSNSIFSSEGFVVVTIAWILLSLFGGLPLLFSGQFETLVDVFFETSSGFTTTGASVLSDVSGQSNSIIFWKAMIQAIGGMGILVFALAIIPNADKQDIHLMKAEVPGPVFGKLVAKIGDTARVLYKIYFALITLLVVLLVIFGMPLFDAIVHSFETAGTGGFSVRNGSVAFYNSFALEMIIAVFMLVFSVNFTLFHLILIKKVREAVTNDELKWMIGIVVVSTVLIMANLIGEHGLLQSFRYAFFTVSSTLSTTGFSNTDFGYWPLFSQIIILITMIIGGSAGSTAGGLKVSRVATAIKSAFLEIKKSRNPKRILILKFDGKIMDSSYLRSLSNYFALYIMIFIVLLISVSFDVNDFMTAFSAVATTFNNVGPGLAEVGPSASFDALSDFNKVLLSFGMIAGRLEIIPMIVLFSPETWKRT